jgi:hypothetical protein
MPMCHFSDGSEHMEHFQFLEMVNHSLKQLYMGIRGPLPATASLAFPFPCPSCLHERIVIKVIPCSETDSCLFCC